MTGDPAVPGPGAARARFHTAVAADATLGPLVATEVAAALAERGRDTHGPT